MLKKLFIGGIIFFILAVGIATYFLFFRSSNQNDSTDVITTDFPISGDRPVASLPPNQSTTSTPNQNPFLASILVKVSSAPVAGGAAVSIASTTIIRYTERGTGHISDVYPGTGELRKVVNTTVPTVYESQMDPQGKNVLLRYVDEAHADIYTSGYVFSTSATSTAQFTSYPINIRSVAYSPSGKEIFYIQKTADGADGIVAAYDGSNPKKIFDSSVSEWIVSWPEANTIMLATNASATDDGFAYFLNPKTQEFKKVLGDIRGLTVLVNPTATHLAYSDSNNTLNILSLKDATVINTGVNTLTDKCTWSTVQTDTLYCAVPESLFDGAYPDVWYLGFTSSNDAIYKIIPGTAPELVGSLVATYKQSIDVINPTISPDGNFFIFGNKKDFSLWSLRITPQSTLNEPQV